jgi:hypothetical protein
MSSMQAEVQTLEGALQHSMSKSRDRPLGWWIVDIGWVWRKQIWRGRSILNKKQHETAYNRRILSHGDSHE